MIALSRTISAYYCDLQVKRGAATGSRSWELAYELGAWFYAGWVGLMAFAVLVRSDDAIIHMLAVSLATGYSGGISGRNAGRVHLAVGQVFMPLAPPALGLSQVEETGYRSLSGVLVSWCPGKNGRAE